MDLKEIIKWFIPCFHILLLIKNKMNLRLIWICLFLLFNSCPTYGANVNNNLADLSETKNVVELNYLNNKYNLSDIDFKIEKNEKSLDTSVGRTFGRPFKKMIQALVPLAFQIGAASSWAVVAALVGVKTLGVTLLILKLLLLAGALKLGVLFGQKTHTEPHSGWQPPPPPPHQKEIHLHIHNGQHSPSDEHYPISTWNRDGAPVAADTKNDNYVVNPYSGGPQTIHTPYGNYVKVDPTNSVRK